MMKHILASTALATLLAGGVYAQTDPAADPAQDPAAPIIEQDADGMSEPMVDDAAPDVVQDDTVAPEAAPLAGDADTMAAETEWAPVDLASFSTDRLIGADIVTANDETIATIEDVIISDTGEVENVVAQFGGFLGFGADRVLLTMDEIEVLQDANENLLVRSSLTPESIGSRPVYE